MATDDLLTQRIQAALGALPGLVSKKMFGGVGFLLQGNMACGIHKGSLIVRLGPEQGEQALKQPHVRPFDMTGRPMAGWIMVDPPGFETDEELERWVRLGVEYALSLPPK